MIEFKGEVPPAVKKDMLGLYNRKQKMFLLTSLLIMFVLTVITTGILVGWGTALYVGTPFTWLMWWAFPDDRAELYLSPNQITISDGKVTVVGKNQTSVRSLKDVTNVIDKGNYYIIYFRIFYKYRCCACVKELLEIGTLEQFEQMFDINK